MIIDSLHPGVRESVSCDICIVGAGPAGIALALELAHAGKDVVLLESGGMKFSTTSTI